MPALGVLHDIYRISGVQDKKNKEKKKTENQKTGADLENGNS